MFKCNYSDPYIMERVRNSYVSSVCHRTKKEPFTNNLQKNSFFCHFFHFHVSRRKLFWRNSFSLRNYLYISLTSIILPPLFVLFMSFFCTFYESIVTVYRYVNCYKVFSITKTLPMFHSYSYWKSVRFFIFILLKVVHILNQLICMFICLFAAFCNSRNRSCNLLYRSTDFLVGCSILLRNCS